MIMGRSIPYPDVDLIIVYVLAGMALVVVGTFATIAVLLLTEGVTRADYWEAAKMTKAPIRTFLRLWLKSDRC